MAGSGRRAELVEVAPAAERGTGTVEHDAHRRVGLRHRQRVEQLVAHPGVVGVADGRTVEREVQDVAVAPHPHPRPIVVAAGPGRSPSLEPPGVLGPRLQQRVRGGLGHQALGHGAASLPRSSRASAVAATGWASTAATTRAAAASSIDDHVDQAGPGDVVGRVRTRCHAHDDHRQRGERASAPSSARRRLVGPGYPPSRSTTTAPPDRAASSSRPTTDVASSTSRASAMVAIAARYRRGSVVTCAQE